MRIPYTVLNEYIAVNDVAKREKWGMHPGRRRWGRFNTLCNTVN